MHLYIASTNPGKLRDFTSAARADISIEPLPNLSALPTPAEDELTFDANARAKALFYSLHTPGHIVLADDSGLEVHALHGAPGVRSARFADDSQYATNRPLPPDQRNNLCLLDSLATTREDARGARYRCVIAAARDGVLLATGEGVVEGEILAVPRGNGGFGYDPLFYLPDEGLTMAELAPASRLAISHRGHALRDLLPRLKSVENQAPS